MSLLRYISHADVIVDPAVPVPEWGLSPVGRSRVTAMLEQPWIHSIRRVVSSAETKALETSEILTTHLGLTVEIRPATGETDRSATGYVPHERHEELARRYFARPGESADGWERAIDSQTRVVEATADLLADLDGDVAVVGHGGVGTLLWCHLAGVDIDRGHDQPGQGHYWTYDRAAGGVVHPWRPIEELRRTGR